VITGGIQEDQQVAAVLLYDQCFVQVTYAGNGYLLNSGSGSPFKNPIVVGNPGLVVFPLYGGSGDGLFGLHVYDRSPDGPLCKGMEY
jgi:hypothetical protein